MSHENNAVHRRNKVTLPLDLFKLGDGLHSVTFGKMCKADDTVCRHAINVGDRCAGQFAFSGFTANKVVENLMKSLLSQRWADLFEVLTRSAAGLLEDHGRGIEFGRQAQAWVALCANDMALADRWLLRYQDLLQEADAVRSRPVVIKYG